MLKKINLNPGSAFEIELAATRGAGGFTANINIVEDAPKAAVVPEPVKRAVVAKPQSVVTEKQKELPLEATPEVPPKVVEEADAAQPPEGAAEPTPVKRQLFGSLTKPVNS